MKKGISSIIGALIFLQILLVSILLILHIQNEENNVTLSAIQKFQKFSEEAPIAEFVDNGVTYIYSPYPLEITHIIYPNGEIKNVSIIITKTPISNIIGNFNWAIIVTSDGQWFNITRFSNSTAGGIIIFPYYEDYGEPISGIVKTISSGPNWEYLGGILSPGGYALREVNLTVDGQKFNYAITGAEVVFYPQSQWINVTFYARNYLTMPDIYPSYGQIVCINKYQLQLYLPVNVTFLISNSTGTYKESAIEYLYIYTEGYLYSYGFPYNISPPARVSPQVTLGSVPPGYPPDSYSHFIPYYLGGYDFNPVLYYPPCFENSTYANGIFIGSGGTIFENLNFNLVDTGVWQFDMNLEKGVFLVYVLTTTSKWLLVANFTAKYNVWFYNEYPSFYYKVLSYQILSTYPSYLVVPEYEIGVSCTQPGVYLLEIST